jgi:hypothetical protein
LFQIEVDNIILTHTTFLDTTKVTKIERYTAEHIDIKTNSFAVPLKTIIDTNDYTNIPT